MEKKTILETLVKIYNDVEERMVAEMIDERFFLEKAQSFKKRSPDYVSNMKTSKDKNKDLHWSRLLLRVINGFIEEEKKPIKVTKV